MFDKKEYEQHCLDYKACCKKEIEATRELIKDALGEDNEKYYQIAQMLRLIEYDFNAMFDAQLQLFDLIKELEQMIEKCNQFADEIEHRQEKKKEELPKDILSEIVRSVNQLDEPNKINALSYIRGMVNAYRESRRKN